MRENIAKNLCKVIALANQKGGVAKSFTTARSFDEIGEAAGESGRTVQRFIRLSYLSDELLELVDSGKIGIVQGVDISFINDEYRKLYYEE